MEHLKVMNALDAQHTSSRVDITGVVVTKIRINIVDYSQHPCLTIDLLGCDNPNDLCPLTCLNGGQCFFEETCYCPAGYQGQRCESQVSAGGVSASGACATPLGMADGAILDTSLSVSSSRTGHGKEKARYGCCTSDIGGAWCPADDDLHPWYEVKFDKAQSVGGIDFLPPTTVPGQAPLEYMKTFELQYWSALDTQESWRTFTKDIPAVYNDTLYYTIQLDPTVVIKAIRILPQTSKKSPCIRFEVLGCDPKGLCPADFCKNGGSCMGQYSCLCKTGFFGNQCEHTANQLVTVNAGFKAIINQILQTTTHITFTVNGNPQLVPGQTGQAIHLTNSNQYLVIDKTNFTSCLSDIDQCTGGFTITTNVNFAQLSDNTYIISSGGNLPNTKGIALYYQGGQLHFVVSTSTQTWHLTTTYTLTLNVWHHLELSWQKNIGCELIDNGKLVGSVTQPQQKQSTIVKQIAIGYSHSVSTATHISMKVEGFQTVDANRASLIVAGMLQTTTVIPHTTTTEAPTTVVTTTPTPTTAFVCGNKQVNFDFLGIKDNILITPQHNFTVYENPAIKPESNGKAVLILNKTGQYVELPNKGIECIQDMTKCDHGFTLSLEIKWLNMNSTNKRYIFSSGGDKVNNSGLALYLWHGELYCSAKKDQFIWTAKKTLNVNPNEWHSYQVSWNMKDGFIVFLDGQIFMEHSIKLPNPAQPGTFPLLIATTPGQNDTSLMEVRNLYTWTASRDVLINHTCITEFPTVPPTTTEQPTTTTTATTTTIATTTPKPEIPKFEWNFSTIPHGTTIIGSKFNATLHGTMSVNSTGININNNSQYIDLGIHKDHCFGNLSLCSCGLTIKITIMFTKLEENTVIISSGAEKSDGTGVAMVYRYGQVQCLVSTSTDTWFATIKREKLVFHQFHQIIISWSPKYGLKIIVNNYVISSVTTSIKHQMITSSAEHMYIGNPPSVSSSSSSCNYFMSSVIIWHCWIDNVVGGGQITPPVPEMTTARPTTTRPTTQCPTTQRPTTQRPTRPAFTTGVCKNGYVCKDDLTTQSPWKTTPQQTTTSNKPTQNPTRPTDSMTDRPTKPTELQTDRSTKPTDSKTDRPTKPTESQTDRPTKTTELQTDRPTKTTELQTDRPTKPSEPQTDRPTKTTDSKTDRPTKPTELQTDRPTKLTEPQTDRLTKPTDSKTDRPTKPTEALTTPTETKPTTIPTTPQPSMPSYTAIPHLSPGVSGSGMAYFSCQFEKSKELNVEFLVCLHINTKCEKPVVVNGNNEEVKFTIEEINQNLFRKEISCSVQARFKGQNLVTVLKISNIIIPDIKLVTTGTLILTEGHPEQYIVVNVTSPPQMFCCQGCQGNCKVTITTHANYENFYQRCERNKYIAEVLVGWAGTSQSPDATMCGTSVTQTTHISSWQQTISIPVKATVDGRIDQNTNNGFTVQAHVVNQPKPPVIATPHTINVGQVQVQAKNNDHSGQCSSLNDPHIATFDGRHYDNHNGGEFILYRHTSLPYEVRGYYTPCGRGSRVYCNCGAAVKSGDDVITFSTCTNPGNSGNNHGGGFLGMIFQGLQGGHGRPSMMAVDLFKNGELTPGTKILRIGCGQKYQVILPTGTVVTIQSSGSSFINIWITPSSVDRGQTEGLCGNYDGNSNNDVHGPNGQPDGNKNPQSFCMKWKSPHTIFYGVSAAAFTHMNTFCSCINGKEVFCDRGHGITYCPPSPYDITSTIISQAKIPHPDHRRRRSLSDDVPTTDAVDQVEANTTFTVAAAFNKCKELIDQSEAVKTCWKTVNRTDLNTSLENCADDLHITGDVVWASGYITDIVEECLNTISRKQEITNGTIQPVGQLNTSALCQQNCGQHGECVEGVCKCAPGFSGLVCDVSADSTIPDIAAGGVSCGCDRRITDDCNTVTIYGDGFVESPTLTCFYDYIKVPQFDKPVSLSRSVPAKYVSINQVTCRLPEVRDGVYVSVSNNGRQYSNNTKWYLHTVYDSKCYDCDLTGKASPPLQYTRKDRICIINGDCFGVNEKNKMDTCKVCDPSNSVNTWTLSGDTSCKCSSESEAKKVESNDSSSQTVTILAVILGVACFVTMVSLFYNCKLRSKQSLYKKSSQYDVTDGFAPPHKSYDNDAYLEKSEHDAKL